MGDRGQVKFILDADKPAIWFYTHWGAHMLPNVVSAALLRGRSRWDDPEYLARIVFCEMIKDDVEALTGYGIGSVQHGDVWRVVEVNAPEKTVRLLDDDKPVKGPWAFETFAAHGEVCWKEEEE